MKICSKAINFPKWSWRQVCKLLKVSFTNIPFTHSLPTTHLLNPADCLHLALTLFSKNCSHVKTDFIQRHSISSSITNRHVSRTFSLSHVSIIAQNTENVDLDKDSKSSKTYKKLCFYFFQIKLYLFKKPHFILI